jgi:UDP-3-O-[3-hydroxymyristoyl] glucosamine N-acyltransferase
LKLNPNRTLIELADHARAAVRKRLDLLGSPNLSFDIVPDGDETSEIRSISPVESVEPGSLTFATSPAYLQKAVAAGAAAVIIPFGLDASPTPSLKTSDPRLVFSVLLELAGPSSDPVPSDPGNVRFKDKSKVVIGEDTIIGDWCYLGVNVKIGSGCRIYPYVFIDDDVVLGDGCVIFPRVTILHGCELGNHVIVHTGAVIGDDGFGYSQVPDTERGRLLHVKNPHHGHVIIEDFVEIGSQVCIDRGLADVTRIGEGTKIDNLVQVAHNVCIGKDAVILSQAGLAGSCLVGDRVFVLGQVGMVDGVTVGDDAIILGKGGVTSDVPPGRQAWAGRPLHAANDEWKVKALARRELPRLRNFWRLFKKAGSFDELRNEFFKSEKSRKEEE